MNLLGGKAQCTPFLKERDDNAQIGLSCYQFLHIPRVCCLEDVLFCNLTWTAWKLVSCVHIMPYKSVYNIISGFRRFVNDIFALLRCYAA
jgi:hypothetical protein